jgi:hypothetical protein
MMAHCIITRQHITASGLSNHAGVDLCPLRKGQPDCLEGRIQLRDRSSTTTPVFEIVAEKIEFIRNHDYEDVKQVIAELSKQRARVTPIRMGLHEGMCSAGMSYFEATRSMLQWPCLPEKSNLEQAAQHLVDSRLLKSDLESSPWMNSH